MYNQDTEDKEEKGVNEIAALFRKEAYDIGYGHGKASVRPLVGVDESVRNSIKKPDDDSFNKSAVRYEERLKEYLKEQKDKAVKKKANPALLDDIETQKKYANDLNAEIEVCRSNEFYSKNLNLYILFALLLCLGDILMGDFLAKEVLHAEKDAWWKGILLGLFCIALGVILEILINSLYNNQKNKKAFKFIISAIPVITIFMFVGMGVLRASSVNLENDASAIGNDSNNILPPWTVITFFIGMSLAALTALGCVLFVIQKKVMLNREIKHKGNILERVGMIINTERLLAGSRENFAKELSSEYDIGFNNGMNEELFKKPEPKALPDPPFQGSLADMLKMEILKDNGLSIFLISVMAVFCSCGPQKTGKPAADCLVFSGLSRETSIRVLEMEMEKLPTATDFSVIWPGGTIAYGMMPSPESSLIASPTVNSKTAAWNKKGLDSLMTRFRQEYYPDTITASLHWNEKIFRLLTLASEQFHGQYRKKSITIWTDFLPEELLPKTDSLIQVEARADAAFFYKKYVFSVNQLAGSVITLKIISSSPSQGEVAELLRRTRRYYRELLFGFNAVVVSVNTETI